MSSVPLLPAVCSPRAFYCMQKELPRLETTDGLLFGATAIAMHSMSDLKEVDIDRDVARICDHQLGGEQCTVAGS